MPLSPSCCFYVSCNSQGWQHHGLGRCSGVEWNITKAFPLGGMGIDSEDRDELQLGEARRWAALSPGVIGSLGLSADGELSYSLVCQPLSR